VTRPATSTQPRLSLPTLMTSPVTPAPAHSGPVGETQLRPRRPVDVPEYLTRCACPDWSILASSDILDISLRSYVVAIPSRPLGRSHRDAGRTCLGAPRTPTPACHRRSGRRARAGRCTPRSRSACRGTNDGACLAARCRPLRACPAPKMMRSPPVSCASDGLCP